MNKFVAFAAAGVLSVSALVSGQAFAGNNENSAFAQMVRANTYGHSAQASDAGTVGYGYNPGFLSKASRDSSVTIRYTNELPRAERVSVIDRAKADPATVEALRSDIRQNESVLRGLQARNVNVDSVIGANHAADGSTIYIIR
ncbi:hypothetical protein [Rhizobium sp. C1]|uniref:hypothetical protein n=1 Tax=Rhizobium sp. C1 TaxID=1349799 RepID=UPI001E2DAADA|nr:hypothetical protein [Rhizobium sp. C1]MCD2176643.1 hypothetical protein [Rhizobium sp. C1]